MKKKILTLLFSLILCLCIVTPAITVFTDAGIEYIGKQIKGDLSDGNFAGAFDKFADLCDDFITQARTGEPYDVKNLPKEPLSLIWIPIAIVVGFVLSLIIVGNM